MSLDLSNNHKTREVYSLIIIVDMKKKNTKANNKKIKMNIKDEKYPLFIVKGTTKNYTKSGHIFVLNQYIKYAPNRNINMYQIFPSAKFLKQNSKKGD